LVYLAKPQEVRWSQYQHQLSQPARNFDSRFSSATLATMVAESLVITYSNGDVDKVQKLLSSDWNPSQDELAEKSK
jgi:hypothetical protein